MPSFKPAEPTNVVDFPKVKEAPASQDAVAFVPPTIKSGPADFAKSYVSENQSQKFTMSDVVKIQSGVQKLETAKLEFDVQTLVDRRLKELHKTAHDVGFTEGKEAGHSQAYQEAKTQYDAQLAELHKVTEDLRSLKTQLLKQNENHFIKLTFSMARKLLQSELKAQPDVVLKALQTAVEESQTEEKIKLHLNPDMIALVKSMSDAQLPAGIEFIEDTALSFGSCVVETDYGTIDSKVEERVEKLWSQMEGHLHQAQEKFTP